VNALEHGGVLDASVGVKLVRLDEPLVSEGLQVIEIVRGEPHVWASPDIFDLECANAMAKASRLAGLTADEALEAFALLRELPHVRFETARLIPDALPLALDLGLSVYDACYVVLAELLGLPLVTADTRLVRALAGSGHRVLHLANIDLASA
jgi:predicted nucleic acid-binding protein